MSGWGWFGVGFFVYVVCDFFHLPLLLNACALEMVGQELLPHPLITQQARRSRRRPCWHMLLPAMPGEEPPAPFPALQYQNKHQSE